MYTHLYINDINRHTHIRQYKLLKSIFFVSKKKIKRNRRHICKIVKKTKKLQKQKLKNSN